MISRKSKIKNKFIKVFVKSYKFLNRSKINLFDSQSPRILIVSTSTIGDTLWATPSIRAIKEKYPNSHLALLVINPGKQILKNNPFIDEIICLKEPILFNFFSAFLHLRRSKFQVGLIFHTSQRIILPICSFLNLEKIVGVKGMNKDLDFLLDKAIPNDLTHEIVKKCNITKEINVNCKNFSLDLFLSNRDRNNLLKLVPINSTKPLICMHPGANDKYKCWPPSYYIELGKMIKNNLDCELYISGTPKEKVLVESVSDQIKDSIAITDLKLDAFLTFIEKMDLLITNDTGPLHIASALKTNIAAIFSPTNPSIYGPYRLENAVVISKEQTCIKCIKRKCLNPFCLWQISPKETYKIIFNKFNFTKYKK